MVVLSELATCALCGMCFVSMLVYPSRAVNGWPGHEIAHECDELLERELCDSDDYYRLSRLLML